VLKRVEKCAVLRYAGRPVENVHMEDKNKISVVLSAEGFERFDAYCTEKGFKKSTLIARLIREHMDREGFRIQGTLSTGQQQPAATKSSRGAKRPSRRGS
jgi:hypothetical protein